MGFVFTGYMIESKNLGECDRIPAPAKFWQCRVDIRRILMMKQSDRVELRISLLGKKWVSVSIYRELSDEKRTRVGTGVVQA